MFRLILDGKLHHIPDLKDPQVEHSFYVYFDTT